MSYSINLLFMTELQYLESILLNVCVAMSGQPRASFPQEYSLFTKYAYNMNILQNRSIPKEFHFLETC